MDTPKRNQVLLYFRNQKMPEWLLAVVAVGILVLIAAESWTRLLGLATLAGAGIYGFRRLAGSPDDAAIDATMRADITALKARAMQRCNLDPAEIIRPPEVIVGPRFNHLGGAQFGFRRGADGNARFTPLHVTIVNFTEHQLVTYQCALDLTTGKPLNERGQEFFYTDVVAASRQCDSYTYDTSDLDPAIRARAPKILETAVNGKIQVAGADLLRLTTAAGTSIEVMLDDPSLIEQLGGGEVYKEQNNNAVKAILHTLRTKKAGALPLRRATF